MDQQLHDPAYLTALYDSLPVRWPSKAVEINARFPTALEGCLGRPSYKLSDKACLHYMLRTIATSAFLTAFIFLMAVDAVAGAEDASPQFSAEQIEFFEAKIRPLLADRCYQCHSEQAKQVEAGLRLDGREVAIRGGDTGAAIVPGKVDESLLVDAIRWQSLEMPPKGKLPEQQIALVERWIEMGAPWPSGKTAHTGQDTESAACRPNVRWPSEAVEIVSFVAMSIARKLTTRGLNEHTFYPTSPRLS